MRSLSVLCVTQMEMSDLHSTSQFSNHTIFLYTALVLSIIMLTSVIVGLYLSELHLLCKMQC